MLTLLAMGGFVLLSCLATAGLIASTQNQSLDKRSFADLNIGPDVHA